MRFSRLFVVLGSALLTELVLTGAPVTVLTDPAGISGFELFGYEFFGSYETAGVHVNGLHWWSGPARCPGSIEFPRNSTIRWRATVRAATHNLANACTNLQGTAFNVVRDEAYAYFFVNSQLHRKPLSASESDGSEPVPTPPFAPTLRTAQLSGWLELADGFLYWGRYLEFSGVLNIYRMPADASSAPELAIGITSGAAIRKMRFFTYVNGGGDSIDALAVLMENGDLYRCNLTAGTSAAFASRVTDFAMHTRGPGGGYVTSIYAAIGTFTPDVTLPAGTLLRINADTGAPATVFVATGNNQVLSVTTDSEQFVPLGGGAAEPKNIYLTEASTLCDPACHFASSTILRHTAPGALTGWVPMVTTTGGGAAVAGNLRSDDRSLYFIDGNDLKKESTSAPPIEFDIAALRLEVVQTIQDLANSVPLVANKDGIFVRGYAYLRANTTGLDPYFPDATLRVYLNAAEIPGSPFSPLNSAAISGRLDMAYLRTNRDVSFLFKLPPLSPGGLGMSMTVNPKRALIESTSTPGSDPYANNSVALSPSLPVVARRSPCLVVVPMNTPYGIYSHKSPGFWDIIRRAETLLPVPELGIYVRSDDPMDDYFVRDSWWFNDPADNGKAGLALDGLAWLRCKTKSPCPDTHFVGLLTSNVVWRYAGLSRRENDNTPIPDLLVKMATAPSGAGAWNDPPGGLTLAHELGHNYGRRHVNQISSPLGCGGSAPGCASDDPAGCPDPAYPFDTCTFGPDDPFAWFGLDPISQRVITPTGSADLMSYAPSKWISSYTYGALFGLLPAGGGAFAGPLASGFVPAGGGGDFLLVGGYIDTSRHTARLLKFYSFPAGTADQERIAESQAASARAGNSPDPFRLVLLDAAGATLGDVPVAVLLEDDPPTTLRTFTQFIPFHPQARRLLLVQDGTVFAERIVSPHAPTLTLNPLALDPVGQTLSLSWSASDADGDPLEFTVQYSADDGATWTAVRIHYPWLATTISTRALSGSPQGRLRVIVTDGVNTGLATTPPFTLPNHAPEAIISGVPEGARLAYRSRSDLGGMILDAENGRLSAGSLNWSIAGPTPLTATGSTVPVDNLSPGLYTATLSGVDSDNQIGSTSRSFEILPLTVPDGSAPVLDGLCNDPGYAGATCVRLPLGSGEVACARLVHAGSYLFVSFTELKLPSGGETRRTIGLRVDANASRDALGAAGDIGFFVDNDGVTFQEIGTGAGMARTASPQLGFVAVVQTGSNAWNAEFRITDSLVGGWNHAAGITFAHDTVRWPALASDNSPATWAPAFFGSAPPGPAPRPPVASAGPPRFVNVGATRPIGLDGTASFDPDGDALSFSWTQVAGPSVTLSNATTAAPSFVASPVAAATELRFQLTVSDGTFTSAPSETSIILLPTPAPPAAPTVRALSDGGLFEGRLPAPPGAPFAIEASTNLINWFTIRTNAADFFGVLDFIDCDSALYP